MRIDDPGYDFTGGSEIREVEATAGSEVCYNNTFIGSIIIPMHYYFDFQLMDEDQKELGCVVIDYIIEGNMTVSE